MTDPSLPFLKALPYLSVIFQIGIMLCALLFIRHIISRPENKRFFGSGEDGPESLADFKIPPEVEVFTVDGLFALGALHKFDEVSRSVSSEKPKVRILRLKQVMLLDSSGLFQLRNFKKVCDQKGIKLLFSDISPDFIEMLKDSWVEEMIKKDLVFLSFSEALKRAEVFL